MSKLVYAVGSFWAGVKLQTVRENFATSRSLMLKQNNLMYLAHQTPIERTLLTLVGVNESDLPEELDLGGASPHAEMLIFFNKMYTR